MRKAEPPGTKRSNTSKRCRKSQDSPGKSGDGRSKPTTSELAAMTPWSAKGTPLPQRAASTRSAKTWVSGTTWTTRSQKRAKSLTPPAQPQRRPKKDVINREGLSASLCSLARAVGPVTNASFAGLRVSAAVVTGGQLLSEKGHRARRNTLLIRSLDSVQS